MAQKLAGKVAIVTGASKGIGAGIAKQLAAEGASVVVNYATSKEGADRVANEITKHGGKAITVKADVAKADEVDRLFTETKKAFGRLDILVNNAGVYEFSPIGDFTEGHFHKQFDINVLGLLLASRKAASCFGPEGGSIINISSAVSTFTPPNSAVYTGTKGAVDAITRTLAKELGPRNIRVNSINPGMVVTEGVVAAGFSESEFRAQIEAQTPLGRIGEVQDIAPAAVFFASSDASWITGETLFVAGGSVKLFIDSAPIPHLPEGWGILILGELRPSPLKSGILCAQAASFLIWAGKPFVSIYINPYSFNNLAPSNADFSRSTPIFTLSLS